MSASLTLSHTKDMAPRRSSSVPAVLHATPIPTSRCVSFGRTRDTGRAEVAQPRWVPDPTASVDAPLARQELAEAISAVARGDRTAFALVYARTSAKLYGIIFRIVRRRDVADDVLQEVYLRIWQRASDFDPTRGAPITWLATLARNRALDEGKRRTTSSLEEFPEVFGLPSLDDPVAELEEREAQHRLQTCLDRLEPEKRTVILMAYYHGMTREEIARRTGRPSPTVKTWIRRSLARMKENLGE
jgi:RNA polymerase sigma-70 factor, ECF subfamily